MRARKVPVPCECGCGAMVKRRFVPGHNRTPALHPSRYVAEDRGYRTPCWIWQGVPSRQGYGRVHLGGRTTHAHRAIYQQFQGNIPDGLHIDHLCRVRICVNPNHLEPVTPLENILRGIGPALLSARQKAKYAALRAAA